MKYLPLVWSALFRRKTRTLFTLFSVMAAFLLFGLLDSVRTAFIDFASSAAGAHRLWTGSRISESVDLPKSLYSHLQTVPGVREVSYQSWFGAYYQQPMRSQFVTWAVPDNYFDLYPELLVSPAEMRAFDHTRTGAIVGAALARRYHWKIGDKIPLQATLFPQKNGSNTWTFDLVGIYHAHETSKNDNAELAIYFHWDYLDEARAFDNGNVSWYLDSVADPKQADRVAQAIDAVSANSNHETRTQSENALIVSSIGRFADVGVIVGAIMGAVFFTLIFLTGNAMAQAVRERTPELAVLKTIGFSSRSVLALVLAESVLLLGLGGAAGLALADVVVRLVLARLGPTVPLLPVGLQIWLEGIGLMIAIGLLVGALPARRGLRLRIVDALAGR